ncbi:MAG: hypothetical protein GY839_14190 [candidate division Zixibacteria bacterium]|nr:hypothetical protein [candidate division Zixibacteria bacterium]
MRRYKYKGGGTHLLWWTVGAIAYGLGTGLEASITLLGNSPELTKAWYIAGALLGGYPLAQGTVYLLLKRKTANILTAVTIPIIVILSILVWLSPVNLAAMIPHKPGGAILGWQWIRIFTPIINGYASVYLIGGAIFSAWRFAKRRAPAVHVIGNSLIALGALLPGIGGGMAKAGIVEALYIGEFMGIIIIWIGYWYRVKPAPRPTT